MEFGELLKQLRLEAGLSQNALARAAGIDPTNLNRIERGKQGQPRRGTALKLIRGLGLPLSDRRAQKALSLAGSSGAKGSKVSATLGSPLRIQNQKMRTGMRSDDLQAVVSPLLRQLKLSVLAALERVAELEEIIKKEEQNENED